MIVYMLQSTEPCKKRRHQAIFLVYTHWIGSSEFMSMYTRFTAIAIVTYVHQNLNLFNKFYDLFKHKESLMDLWLFTHRSFPLYDRTKVGVRF